MNNAIIGLQPENGQPNGSATDLIKDSDTANFVADVIEESKSTPVLVDFWAPWCGPCKQLGPIIENAVTQAGGKVKLVKVNVDENQEIAQQMRVQSIPAVFAFVNGQPVDGFMGAKTEGEINQFIDKVAAAGPGSPDTQITELLDQANIVLQDGDIAKAAQIFSAIMQADNQNVDAITGLARCQIAAEDFEAADKTLSLIPQDSQEDIEVVRVKNQLRLALNPIDEKKISALMATIAAEPDNYDTRYELSLLLNDANKRQAALDQLFYIVEHNRSWNDEAARKRVLDFFEGWGQTDPSTIEGRKQLSSILFS